MLRTIILISLLFGLPFGTGTDQEHRETISRTYTFEGSADRDVLIIKNIFGSVHIEGHGASDVALEVEKLITADNQDDLQEGIRDITLGVLHTGDSIVFYTDSPYSTLKRKNGKVSIQWNNDSEDIDYKWNFDYTVKVPFGTWVDISTVTDGDVSISDTRAPVSASNVNGSVSLTKTKSVLSASTVNGTLDCEILEKPESDCMFHTVNGDMNVSYPPNLSADISYESMNGDFYTDFDVKVLPSSVERLNEATSEKTTYKIEKNPRVRIGDGAVNIRFITLNGDMIVKKTKQ